MREPKDEHDVAPRVVAPTWSASDKRVRMSEPVLLTLTWEKLRRTQFELMTFGGLPEPAEISPTLTGLARTSRGDELASRDGVTDGLAEAGGVTGRGGVVRIAHVGARDPADAHRAVRGVGARARGGGVAPRGGGVACVRG